MAGCKMQRFFDIVFSGLALVVLAPLLIPIIIVLKFTGESEIFFTQQRVGKGGKMFGLLKFATMLKDSPNIGTGTITVQGDPRVLPFGKFLRKSKINELPQLINILKGNMSVIGPRPQDMRCFVVFDEQDQANIKKVRPGLSGIGSIIFRDEEGIMAREDIKDKEAFYDDVISPYKGKVESWYVGHQSIGLYFKLIWLTVVIVFFPHREIRYGKLFENFPEPPEELHLRETKR
jgi:lipopolysaccharide/colanic/teichoic acid biosynthesis glycosyltransferase